MTRDAKIVYSAEDRTGPATASVKRSLQSVAEVAGMAGLSLASLGSAATIAAFASMVNRINQGVDALNDLKDATGASIENISALERVAKLNGTSFDTVGTSLVKFNQALGQTLKPGSDAEKVIKAIGLNAQELRDMDPAEALRQTAVALSQFADDGNKARATQELFGKSLREVAPFLKDLAEAGALNATVTTKQAEEAEKFNKEILKLQVNLSDMGRSIADPVVSGMNRLIQSFRDAKKEGAGFLDLMGMAAQLTTPAGLASYLLGGKLGGNRNGYTTAREGVTNIEKALADPTLSASERSALVGQQTRYRQQLDGYLSSAAGAGRGMGGYEGVPRTSLELPPDDPKKTTGARAARSGADGELREAQRVAEERQRLRIKESEDIRKFFLEQEEIARKSLQAIQREHEKMAELREQDARDSVVAIESRVQALRLELDGYGKLQSAIEETKLARMEEAKEGAYLAGEDIDWINARIEAQRRLVDVLKNTEAQEANREAVETAKRDWDQVAQSMTDALMRGGKSAAQYLKDLFRTLVLRPILAPIGQAMSGVIGSMMGGGSATAGTPPNPFAGGGGVGDMASIGSTIFNGFGGITGAASMFGAGGLGGALTAGAGWLTGATTLGGSLSAAGSLMASGAAGILPGLGMAAGALGPIALAAGLIYTLVAKKKGGPKQDGRFGKLGSGVAMHDSDLTPENNEAAKTAAMALQQQYDAIVRAGGGSGGIQFGLGFSMDPKGTSSTFLDVTASRNGQVAYNGLNLNVGRSEQDLQGAIGEMGGRAILHGLVQSNLTGQIADYLRELGDINTLSGGSMESALTRLREFSAKKEVADQQMKALEDQWFDMTATQSEKVKRSRQKELEALDATNREMALRIYALQDEMQAQELSRAAIERASESSRAAVTYISDFKRGIGGYLDRLNASPAGMLSGEDQLANARSQFDRQLTLASTGDRSALESITGYADQLIAAQTAYTGSGMPTQDILNHVRSSLTALPGHLRPEQFIAQAVEDSSAKITAEIIASSERQIEALRAQLGAVAAKVEGQTAVLASYAQQDLQHGERLATAVEQSTEAAETAPVPMMGP
ncbi:MAG TPA: hypothetical protein VHL79_12325, partial [Ramlibacter sp.]|nr:hypothetical protein [Ramlibacter sp.]